MPPRKDPSKRPGSKGPAGPGAPSGPGGPPRPPSKAPAPSGKPVSKPVAKTGTPPPAPAGKTSKPVMKHGGSAGPLRRSAPPSHSPGKNPKVKLIAVGAAVGLVVIIGALYAVKSSQRNPEAVKKELRDKLAEIDKLGMDQIIKKHEELKKLLQEPSYKEGDCISVFKLLEKAEEDARPLAKRQQEADDKVPPFLQKYEAAKGSLDQSKAQSLLEEASSLFQDYSPTTHGPKLDESRKFLLEWLETHSAATGGAAADVQLLKANADRAANDGDFIRAYKLIDDFVTKYPQESAEGAVKRSLDAIRESLARKLHGFIEETLRDAKDMNDRGQTEEALAKLKQAMDKTQGLEGFSELEGAWKGMGGK
ncbi:MAG: hypothetical protein AAB434_01780 [Planctomycetota bacterium]